MTYHEAEQYILSLGNIRPDGVAETTRTITDSPRRVQFFLDILGNPEKKIPHYIHVTGTSGKGSVCTYLANSLEHSGKKTGLFVSPHPTYLTERWRIQ